MMSKKKWLALLSFHIAYLFIGASIFYNIENPLETRKLTELRKEIIDVQNLVYKNYLPSNTAAQINLLTKLSDICGEPMAANLSLDDPVTPIWDFYHAFFFSYTVISTIGYGNLAPTTSTGRIIMIFYALLGVPMNAILFANLGAYFASSFRKLYSRYKEKNPEQDIDYTISRFGLIGQIVLYLVPGVIVFIFVPACLFVIFEGWDYTLAVYYAFVTLTTIGFGDYVAAVQDNGHGIYFQFYKAFLIFWITFGLGYIGMCIGFLTQGLRSKKVRELEYKLAKNLKETHTRIWSGVSKDVGYLRKIINEISIMRYKPVYRDEIPVPQLHRSSSCPSFTVEVEGSPTFRRRANSEAYALSEMVRTQSDSDLLAIDRKKTFEGSNQVQPIDLLSKVVDALGSIHSEDVDEYSEQGVHGFSDSQILASERKGSDWSIKGLRMFSNSPPIKPRARAISEIRAPTALMENDKSYPNGDWTWNGSPISDKGNNDQLTGLRRREKLSMPNVMLPDQLTNAPNTNILNKLNPFKRKISRQADIEEDRIMPPEADSMSPQEYLRKTARGRFSMFPTSAKPPNYLNASNDMSPLDYLKKTKRGRMSVAPTPSQQRRFLSNTTNELTPEEYLKKTARGRYSMAPVSTQVQRYLNNTKSGRASRISTTSNHADVLEQTTIADLLRAIEALHTGDSPESPRRRLGTVTPPSATNPLINISQPNSNRSRRPSVFAPTMEERVRRTSITPSALPPATARRRFSLHPASGNLPMGPLPAEITNTSRRGSMAPPPYNTSDLMRRRAMSGAVRRISSTAAPNLSPGSRNRQLPLTTTEGIPLSRRPRDNSLPEIKIDKPS